MKHPSLYIQPGTTPLASVCVYPTRQNTIGEMKDTLHGKNAPSHIQVIVSLLEILFCVKLLTYFTSISLVFIIYYYQLLQVIFISFLNRAENVIPVKHKI